MEEGIYIFVLKLGVYKALKHACVHVFVCTLRG